MGNGGRCAQEAKGENGDDNFFHKISLLFMRAVCMTDQPGGSEKAPRQARRDYQQ
jgi:hypothetical protein